MSVTARRFSVLVGRSVAVLLAAALLAVGSQAHAQLVNQAVGGVFVDPQGMIRSATQDELGQLHRIRAEVLSTIPEGLDQPAGERKISLRQLDEAIAKSAASGQPLPTEVLVLGGLTRIRYVLVYPEQHDIVLVGPGEPWKLSAGGEYVGAESGQPVLLLDDLLVALRAVSSPTPSVLSCSIDPTPEGLQRIRTLSSRLTPNMNPQQAARAFEQQLGPQVVSVTGVPESSHFARVMVAADYRMKRIAMGLEPSPVAGLPSFLKFIGSSGGASLPRWWLAPDYQPPVRDADGLAWELPGGSVKTMAENDFLDATGVKRQTGKADPATQKWADVMTSKYEELAQVEPVFGQLRNCMDLAVVAAIMVTHDLPAKAGATFASLMSAEGVEAIALDPPKRVASQATLVRKRNWIVACGGVQINPWSLVEQSRESDALAQVRSQTSVPAGQWWSN